MPVPDWAPSVESVAVYVTSRTVERNGAQPSTFTATTRPTNVQVANLAEQSAEEVLAAVGGSMPSVLEPAARKVASVLAAADIELTYFPNSLGGETSPYDRLRERYQELLLRLIQQVSDNSDDDASTANSGRALFSFPYDPNPVSERQW